MLGLIALLGTSLCRFKSSHCKDQYTDCNEVVYYQDCNPNLRKCTVVTTICPISTDLLICTTTATDTITILKVSMTTQYAVQPIDIITSLTVTSLSTLTISVPVCQTNTCPVSTVTITQTLTTPSNTCTRTETTARYCTRTVNVCKPECGSRSTCDIPLDNCDIPIDNCNVGFTNCRILNCSSCNTKYGRETQTNYKKVNFNQLQNKNSNKLGLCNSNGGITGCNLVNCSPGNSNRIDTCNECEYY